MARSLQRYRNRDEVNNEALMTKCFYRVDGVQCGSGLLYHADLSPVLLEGTSVYCPACEGKGMILTDTGRDFLKFLQKFARPFIRDVVDELFEEHER